MGQTISKAFKINGSSSSMDCSKLSKPSMGALRSVSTGTFNDELSSSTVSSQSQDSPKQQQQAPHEPSLEDAVASARAFFDVSYVSKQPWQTCQGQGQTPSNDFLGSERSPTRPVKCPSAPRVDLFQEPDELQSWNEDDEVEHLTRLYDRRTWQMFCLITEARRHQKRVDGEFREVRHIQEEEGKSQQFSEEDFLDHPGFATAADVSLDHDMIFSCDLE